MLKHQGDIEALPQYRFKAALLLDVSGVILATNEHFTVAAQFATEYSGALTFADDIAIG